MSKNLHALLLILAIFLAGCTANTAEKASNAISSGAQETDASTARFNSSMIAKAGENVYYVVAGSANNDTVVSIRYLAPTEAVIGSRPWSPGQKCISWDASYDWMSSNVKTGKYTVKLISDNSADMSISGTFITKDKNAFEDYKVKNCS